MDLTPDSKPPEGTGQATACTAEPTQRLRKRRLRWLVLAYVAISVSTGTLVAWLRPSTGPDLAVAVWVGIVFCQTSLLGIWGGLGTGPWWIRLFGAIAGMGYLGLLLDLGVGGPYPDNHVILSLAAVLLVGVLMIVRCFRVRVCVATVDKAAVPRIQFSIRQLLILTLAVACMVSLGKWLGPHLIPLNEPFLLALIGLVLATVGLIAVWPVLGTGRTVLPSMMVIAVAAGIGFCFATLFLPHADMAVFWTIITSAEALSLTASLLIVRSCGYRLVRLPSSRTVTRDAVA